MKNLLSSLVIGILILLAASCSGDKGNIMISLNEKLGNTELVPVLNIEKEKYVYLDKNGKEAFGKQLVSATNFLDGIAVVSDTTGLYGYIDTSGKWIIEPKYASATNFNDGLAWVALPDSALMVIDKKGTVKFRNSTVVNASMFMEGYSIVTNPDGDKGLISAKGDVIEFPEKCKSVAIIGDDYFALTNTDSEMSIGRVKGKKFESLPEIPYKIFGYIPGAGIYIIGNDDKFGLADNKGNLICNPQYEMLRYDSRGMFLFKNSKGKYGWLNEKGVEIIPPKYKEVNHFFFGKDYDAVSVTGNKFSLIDKEGKTLINSKYENLVMSRWSDNIIAQKKDEGYGIISPKGDVLCKPQFEGIVNVARDLFMATTDGKKWGMIDKNGIFVGAIEYLPYVYEGARLIEEAESHYFDINYLNTQVKELMDKANYNESIASLAEKFGTSKYDSSTDDWYCYVKNVNLNNLGADLSLFVTLNSPALVRQGYSRTTTKFNPNAYPVAFYLILKFDSMKKCEEAYKYLAKNNGQDLSGDLPQSEYFIIQINRDKSYTVVANEEYD